MKITSNSNSAPRLLPASNFMILLLGIPECGSVLSACNQNMNETEVSESTNNVIIDYTFDFDNMRSMGLAVNDLIAPASITVEKKCLHLSGNKLARVLKVSQLPSQLTDEFLTNVTDMNFNCITTMNYKPIPPKKAEAIVAKNLSFVRDEKQKALKAGQKAGVYDDSYVAPNVLEREAEV